MSKDIKSVRVECTRLYESFQATIVGPLALFCVCCYVPSLNTQIHSRLYMRPFATMLSLMFYLYFFCRQASAVVPSVLSGPHWCSAFTSPYCPGLPSLKCQTMRGGRGLVTADCDQPYIVKSKVGVAPRALILEDVIRAAVGALGLTSCLNRQVDAWMRIP